MSKYNRVCKGVTIDVYDVLTAFNVTNPALQHLVKKALCAGLRGHKDKAQDMAEILESAKRAVELEGDLQEEGERATRSYFENFSEQERLSVAAMLMSIQKDADETKKRVGAEVDATTH